MEPPKVEKIDEKFFISFIPVLDLASEKAEGLTTVNKVICTSLYTVE